MLGVLGIMNPKLEGKFRDKYGKKLDDIHASQMAKDDEGEGVRLLLRMLKGKKKKKNQAAGLDEIPGMEYDKIGLFLGNMFTIMRISMGDFELIAPAQFLNNNTEKYVFWLIWLVIVLT